MDYHGGGPAISVKARGTILNPWYELPFSAYISGLSQESQPTRRTEITSKCCVELPQFSVQLFFEDNEVIFVFTGDSLQPRYLVNPIRYFLIYRTYLNFNIIGPTTRSLAVDTFSKVDHIRFRLERVIRVEGETQFGNETVKPLHHEGKEEWLEITTDDIIRYLNVLNPSLYYALAFYLIGCENPRYFLVEFYKAVEVIKKAFGSEAKLLKSLGQFGVTESKYRGFRKDCNNIRSVQLDISRHAPDPEAPLYAVDLRNMLVESRSLEVLESSTVFCRQVIDAYLAFLIRQAA